MQARLPKPRFARQAAATEACKPRCERSGPPPSEAPVMARTMPPQATKMPTRRGQRTSCPRARMAREAVTSGSSAFTTITTNGEAPVSAKTVNSCP